MGAAAYESSFMVRSVTVTWGRARWIQSTTRSLVTRSHSRAPRTTSTTFSTTAIGWRQGAGHRTSGRAMGRLVSYMLQLRFGREWRARMQRRGRQRTDSCIDCQQAEDSELAPFLTRAQLHDNRLRQRRLVL